MNITLEHCSARHPSAHSQAPAALRVLSLSVASGEQVAIIGPSGAGKTTLLHLLACALRPSEGALNISVWDKFVADKKVDTSKVKVIFTTPPYFDYNWTVHADMPAAQREKLSKAFLSLSPATPEGKEVLDLQRATRFVPTKLENYKGIEAAGRNAGLLK